MAAVIARALSAVQALRARLPSDPPAIEVAEIAARPAR